MSRKSYKSIIAVILSCFMIIQTFDFNCIYAHAATATASFTDSKRRTVNMRCPGSYEVYRTDGPHDMDSTCHRTHVAGCEHHCSYDTSECRHFGEYDGRTSKSDIYGKLEIQTGHFCTGADGNEHETGCSRTRATFTRCNVCHATVLDNSSNALQAIDVCARNGGRAHYVQLSSDGTPRCEYCGINAASTYYGKCNRNQCHLDKINYGKISISHSTAY